MLNPPLSILPNELLACLVEHVASHGIKHLRNLSLSDRAFTLYCQLHLFRTLNFATGLSTLDKMKFLLDEKPSLANQVRVVKFDLSYKHVGLFDDQSLLFIFQVLAKSPTPPNELHFSGHIGDPIRSSSRRLMQSFFPQTLTVLHLSRCSDAPAPLLLIFPELRELVLDFAEAARNHLDNFTDNECSSRRVPAIEILKYRGSQSFFDVMNKSPAFPVLWSKLRVLILSPREQEDIANLQPILDAACNTLEELHITGPAFFNEELALAGLVNLSGLPRLRVFAFEALIRSITINIKVLRDINIVLSTIPASNSVTNLTFTFEMYGGLLFGESLNEDWATLCNKVIRVSSGKPLELELRTVVATERPGREQVYASIKKKTIPLLDHPDVCFHFWKPDSLYELDRFPHAQVRSRCKREGCSESQVTQLFGQLRL